MGALVEAFVEGCVRFDASVRDLMAAAAALLRVSPVEPSNTHWWTHTLQTARSLAEHSP